ncbi:MAG: ferredoxin [Bacteriovoracaceae bacterium]|jgi:ferredoxin
MPSVSLAPDLEKPEEYKTLEVELSQTLYDECERQGTPLPHGCLAGSCGSCRIEVVKGADNLKPASLIEQNTIDALKEELVERYGADFVEGKEIRLACRARLIKDGEVKFRPFK